MFGVPNTFDASAQWPNFGAHLLGKVQVQHQQKRTHVAGSSSTLTFVRAPTKLGQFDRP